MTGGEALGGFHNEAKDPGLIFRLYPMGSCTPDNLFSMFDLLSIQEDQHAAAQGWELAYVYDLRRRTMRPQILALRPHFNNAEQASTFVINEARNRNDLALKAIRLVVHHAKGK